MKTKKFWTISKEKHSEGHKLRVVGKSEDVIEIAKALEIIKNTGFMKDVSFIEVLMDKPSSLVLKVNIGSVAWKIA